MDDPTKDTIPRSAVEYCLRKETVSTNPEAYKAHKKFMGYMDDPEISQFGHWMHSNGFNCALVSIAVDLDKIPSAQPEINYQMCADALLKMWMDDVLTDGDYKRIMNKLNAWERKRREGGQDGKD